MYLPFWVSHKAVIFSQGNVFSHHGILELCKYQSSKLHEVHPHPPTPEPDAHAHGLQTWTKDRLTWIVINVCFVCVVISRIVPLLASAAFNKAAAM